MTEAQGDPVLPALRIDAHSHLDQFGTQLELAVRQIERLGIFTLAVATDERSYEESCRIAESSPLIVPSMGIHPWRAARTTIVPERLERLLATAPMVGEIGLDFHWVSDRSGDDRQRRVFELFIDGAARHRKIVNLHTKGAEREVLAQLEACAVPNPIVHWYSGPLDLVDRYLAAGCYFTIGVDIGTSRRGRDLLALLPDERILTETDNPSGAESLTGAPGLPEAVDGVLVALARSRDVSTGDAARLVERNLRRALAPSPPLTARFARCSKRARRPLRPAPP